MGSALSGGGTYVYFSDSEKTNNTIRGRNYGINVQPTCRK
ncbi:TasA family protein [Virgibacillus siamensis]